MNGSRWHLLLLHGWDRNETNGSLWLGISLSHNWLRSSVLVDDLGAHELVLEEGLGLNSLDNSIHIQRLEEGDTEDTPEASEDHHDWDHGGDLLLLLLWGKVREVELANTVVIIVFESF